MLQRMDEARAVAVIVAAGSGTRAAAPGARRRSCAIGGADRCVVVAIEHGARIAVDRIRRGRGAAGVRGRARRWSHRMATRSSSSPAGGSPTTVRRGRRRRGRRAAPMSSRCTTRRARSPRPRSSRGRRWAVRAGADAAVPVLPLVDTVKRVAATVRSSGRSRAMSWRSRRRPQACRLATAPGRPREGRRGGTGVHRRRRRCSSGRGASVRTVAGEPGNFKITTRCGPGAGRRADRRPAVGDDHRVGLGFDVHPRGRGAGALAGRCAVRRARRGSPVTPTATRSVTRSPTRSSAPPRSAMSVSTSPTPILTSRDRRPRAPRAAVSLVARRRPGSRVLRRHRHLRPPGDRTAP